jgi:hypothetical protein
VLLVNAVDRRDLGALLTRYGIEVAQVEPGEEIPGSFWGESEAGLLGSRLYLRPDTPLHSALHEGAHYVCMTPERRAGLHTDAGGDTDEENAVCYLQIEWAAVLPKVGRQRLFLDMDRWGYSFRLGSAAVWFERDAADARQWLINHGILGAEGQLTYACR